MPWKKFFHDEVRDAFGLSAERDAINDLTEGHPNWRASITGFHKRDFKPIHKAFKGKMKRRFPSRYAGKIAKRRKFVRARKPQYAPAQRKITATLGAKRWALGRYNKAYARCYHSRYTSGNVTDKTVYQTPLIKVGYNANAEDPNDKTHRSGRYVDVRGVRLDMFFQRKFGVDGANQSPIMLRWVIVMPHTNDGSTNISTNLLIDDVVDHDDDTEIVPGTTQDFWTLMQNPINTADYKIVKEGRFKINPIRSLNSNVALPSDTLEIRNERHMHLWLPIRRVMEWPNVTAGATGEQPNRNLYFCYWFCETGATTTDTTGANAMQVKARISTFHRQPKH